MFGYLYSDEEQFPLPPQLLAFGDVEEFWNPVLVSSLNFFDDFEADAHALPQFPPLTQALQGEEEMPARFPPFNPPVVPIFDMTDEVSPQKFIAVAYGLGLASYSEDEDDDATYGWFLNPFIPPPPVICPNFPGGDPDATMSSFVDASGRPIAVLLCRICQSNLPLLVRGDFAIWCQTCCKFVSREDTVMATTKAPKFFRGVF
jgi:hypothetical protein